MKTKAAVSAAVSIFYFQVLIMATRFDKFTVKAQEALQATQEAASRYGNQQLEPVHLLLALVEQPEGTVPAILERVGVRPAAVLQEAEKSIETLPKVGGTSDHHLSPALKEIFDQAFKETEAFKDEFVSTEHLLLALTRKAKSPAGTILARLGITHDAILKALVAVRGSQRVTDPNPEAKYQALERYARDLTEIARRGKLDPVIGRDEEIRVVALLLCMPACNCGNGKFNVIKSSIARLKPTINYFSIFSKLAFKNKKQRIIQFT